LRQAAIGQLLQVYALFRPMSCERQSPCLSYLSLNRFLSNRNTIVYKIVFIIDLGYIHSIKHLADSKIVSLLYDLSF
jgi:hypothetical protein